MVQDPVTLLKSSSRKDKGQSKVTTPSDEGAPHGHPESSEEVSQDYSSTWGAEPLQGESQDMTA